MEVNQRTSDTQERETMTEMISGTSEYETFELDIFKGMRNQNGQSFRFESSGVDILLIVDDGDKSASFKIEFKNRLALEKIKSMSAEVLDAVNKVSNTMLRK